MTPQERRAYGQRIGEGLARLYRMQCTDIEVGDDAVRTARLLPDVDAFTCPISAETMHDPVMTVDGQVYERVHFERWARQRQQEGRPITSPATGLELASTALVSVKWLKEAVQTFCKRSLSNSPGCLAAVVVQASGGESSDHDPGVAAAQLGPRGHRCPRCGSDELEDARTQPASISEAHAQTEPLSELQLRIRVASPQGPGPWGDVAHAALLAFGLACFALSFTASGATSRQNDIGIAGSTPPPVLAAAILAGMACCVDPW